MAKQKLNITWPVAIGIIYAGFVLVMIAFVVFSSFNSIDLVSRDYYAQELKYQQHIDRVERTQQQSNNIQFKYDQSSQLLELQFPPDLSPNDIKGKIVFFRPSDANLDHTHEIIPSPDGKQILKTDAIKPGLWRVKIFWQVNKMEYYNETVVYIN